MKTLIIMYPTVERAAMAWRETCGKYTSLIEKAYRSPFSIKLINGTIWYFRGETEGQRAFRGYHPSQIKHGVNFDIDREMGEEFSE